MRRRAPKATLRRPREEVSWWGSMGSGLLLASMAAAYTATDATTCSSSSGANSNSSCASSLSPLARARALVPPDADMADGGEFEGLEFWQEHEALLEAARLELGPLDESTYSPRPDVDISTNPVVEPTAAPGVYAVKLLSDEFIAKLAAELAHLRRSGIPLRRPNGMNRRGCVLSHLGFGAMIETLFAVALRPLGLRLFPHALRAPDVSHHYAFSILYEPETARGDVALREHADGSSLTMNLCISTGDDDFEGGDLLFRGVRFHDEDSDSRPYVAVPQRPGVALIHLGQHLHAAGPTTAGRRENVIFWATGEHDYVRIAPYDADGNDLKPIY